MAPWPEPQGDEPKAPDKSNNNPDDATSSREEGATAREDIEVKVAAAEDPRVSLPTIANYFCQ